MNTRTHQPRGELNVQDLHAYQKTAADFVENTKSCALWIDLGLGKTAITITAIANLLNRFEVGKILIIAPLRVALYTWPEELHKWGQAEHISYAHICGSKQHRLNALSEEKELNIINRELIPWLVQYYGKNWPYDMVVIDEASSFKSSRTKRFKALRKVLPYTSRVVELTGTPASNGLLDLWSQIFLIDRGERLGRTYSRYRNAFFTSDYLGYRWEPRPNSEQAIHKKLNDICMTLSSDDYLKMPRRIDNIVKVKLADSLYKRYLQLEREFLLKLEQGTVEVFNSAALSNKLLQFANGAVYTDNKKNWVEVHKHKLDALEDIIEEAAGQPVLVAYNFIPDKKRILDRFKQAVSFDEDEVKNRWNKGDIQLLVAHPASVGYGLNLQHGGNIVVWFGLTWSLELYHQFNARLHRQGQLKPVFIHHIIADNTRDHTLLECLRNKHTTQQSLLEALKRDCQLSVKELRCA